MNPFDPFNLWHLSGMGTLRYVTGAATATVRNLLPAGLELGPQKITPEGPIRAHGLSRDVPPADVGAVAAAEPDLSRTQRRRAVLLRGAGRTHFFMPIVLLDDVLATIGGLLFWGYAKRVATIRNADGQYSATAMSANPCCRCPTNTRAKRSRSRSILTSSSSARRCRKRSSRRSRSAWDRSSCSRAFRNAGRSPRSGRSRP